MRLLIADFVIINVVAAALSAMAALFGWGIIDAFVVLLFLFSGIVLIAGGYLGFFASSVSFGKLLSYLRLKRIDTNKAGKEAEQKPERRGLRMVILGGALLAESAALALLLV